MPIEPAAKLWNLLRHSDTFSKAVESQRELLNEFEKGFHELREMDRQNPVAADALRWLVPQPLFLERKVRPIKQSAEMITIRLGMGLTADPRDPNWTWFEGEPEAWPVDRWGPIIENTMTGKRLLGPDALAEWRNYNRRFTLDTPWGQAPPGFQRIVREHWTRLTMGNDSPFRTDFFQG